MKKKIVLVQEINDNEDDVIFEATQMAKNTDIVINISCLDGVGSAWNNIRIPAGSNLFDVRAKYIIGVGMAKSYDCLSIIQSMPLPQPQKPQTFGCAFKYNVCR